MYDVTDQYEQGEIRQKKAKEVVIDIEKLESMKEEIELQKNDIEGLEVQINELNAEMAKLKAEKKAIKDKFARYIRKTVAAAGRILKATSKA